MLGRLIIRMLKPEDLLLNDLIYICGGQMERSNLTGDKNKLHQILKLFDLSSLSISSVAPIFSIAAAGTSMVQSAGLFVPLAIGLIALPFLISSWIFLVLNKHFPNAGASYHWSRRIVGINYSNFQAWIIIMAYFWSIPPILIPASRFTLDLLGFNQFNVSYEILFALIWTAFAGLVLLYGTKLTAIVTQIFLFVEIIAVLLIGVVGYSIWDKFSYGMHSGNIFSFSNFNFSGIIVCMIVGATIVDGWEIDSYASEESKQPKLTPGKSGIIGAIMVVVYYYIIWPILLHETSLKTLQSSPDVLLAWANNANPAILPVMKLALVASTAGSLWLTTFILSRALFSMSRDKIMPKFFGFLSKKRVPKWSILIPLILSFATILLEIFFPSFENFFNIVLATAGFFLAAEFFLDSFNTIIFLLKYHKNIKHSINNHNHIIILSGAFFVFIYLGILLALFFVYGPKYLGSSIDLITAIMLVMGLCYTIWLLISKKEQKIYMADFDDSIDIIPFKKNNDETDAALKDVSDVGRPLF